MKSTIIRTIFCVALAILILSNGVVSASAFGLSGGLTANLTSTSASSTTLIPDGEYYIALHNSLNRGMNVQYASKSPGTARIVVDNLNGESNEIFVVKNHGGNVISILPKHAQHLAINALYGKSAAKGSDITLWNYEAGDNASRWQVIANDDGSVTLKNLACSYVADLNHGSTSIGNNCLLWHSTGELSCQGWYFIPVTTSTVLIGDGYYNILLHDDNKKCLNIQYASTVIDKAAAVVDTLNYEDNETFKVVNRGNGLISIHPKHAENLCLNAQFGSKASKGQNLILHNYDGTTASLWLPIKNPDGSFSLKSAACDWVIDVNRATYTDGNNMLLWEKTGQHRAQSFYFAEAPVKSVGSSGKNLTTAESQIASRLDAMMNGSYGNGAYKLNTRYTGKYWNEECKGFAKRVYEVIFGSNIGSTRSKPYNYQINISFSNTRLVDSLTSLPGKNDSSVRALFAKARPGDFIQVRRNNSSGGSHSMIFLSADSTSITVYECNVDGKNGIQKATYSYSAFRSANTAVSVYTAVNYYLH